MISRYDKLDTRGSHGEDCNNSRDNSTRDKLKQIMDSISVLLIEQGPLGH